MDGRKVSERPMLPMSNASQIRHAALLMVWNDLPARSRRVATDRKTFLSDVRNETKQLPGFLLYRFFFSKPSTIEVFKTPSPKWIPGWIYYYGILRTQARDYSPVCRFLLLQKGEVRVLVQNFVDKEGQEAN